MKIFHTSQIREADVYTICNEPIASIDLMERAANACTKAILSYIPIGCSVKVFCGLGNNGGDGLAIARLLYLQHIPVEVFVIKYSDKYSDDFAKNFERLKAYPIQSTIITCRNDFPKITKADVVIDALLGSGLNKPVEGIVSDIISYINTQKYFTIAVDIPSGLSIDEPPSMPDEIICADITLTFEFPKLSFLFPESEKYIGKFDILPIGLHLTYIENTQTKNYFLTSSFIKPLLKKRKLFSHKGNFGHALLISGSKGKMGASVLASQACLRSGAGLITTHIPAIGYNVIQTAFPECMASIDNKEEYITNLPDLFPYSAVAAGPGIGKDIQTQNVVKLLIQNAICPILLDADALNILGENKTWLGFLPPESILTPHPKEFDNIAGSSGNSFERWQLQSKVSIKYNVFIVLKGHYTSITCPDGNCYFNSTGNPGMATAGSGDVLTGIILGLLAQGYSSKNACIIGVYLHGLAGDIAAEHTGYEALIASDIINKLGMAFGKLRK